MTGQDGTYFARFLLSNGYEVFGTSRDAGLSTFKNLKIFGSEVQVKGMLMDPNDFRSVLQVIFKAASDETYNLSPA